MVATPTIISPTAQNITNLRKVWECLDANSCPSQYNFHMHTIASDGKLTSINLVQQALEIGLKGFAITDHHSVAGYFQAQTYLDQLKNEGYDTQLTLWTGFEITSQLLGVDVHILGYGFDPHHYCLKPYLNSCRPSDESAEAQKVINSIHQAGGLAVLAHPHRYRRSARELVPAIAKMGIDGIEVYYAYGNPNPWQPSQRRTAEAQRLAEAYHLLGTCGTDTHGKSLLQRI